MLCSEFSIVKNERDAPEATILRCKRWTCPDCRPVRQAEVRAQCRAGSPRLMVTLTSAPDPAKSLDEQAQELVRAWQLVVKRYKRLHAQKTFAYFAVVEETKIGQPHLHILTRERFIEHKWLSDTMREITGHYVVWLTRLRSARGGAWYVSKYLGKDPRKFAGTKRYWKSQNWIEDPVAWEADHKKQPGMWTRTERSLFRIVEDFKKRGYHATWPKLDRVLFVFGTGRELGPDGEWQWTVTPDDRRRRSKFGV